jgi:hypothetical protein
MKISATPPDLYIDAEAMAKLRAWTRFASGEVSGLGLVEPAYEDGLLVSLEVTEVFIVKQECTSASTELDQEAVGHLLFELEQAGKADQLKLWWHSHGTLDVFWSTTDDANIERLTTSDFLLSIVVNKHWDVRTRLDWFSPVELTMDELPLHILVPDHHLNEQCQVEVEELVTDVVLVNHKRVWRRPGEETPLWPDRSYLRPVDDLIADPFAFWDGQEPETPFLLEEDTK